MKVVLLFQFFNDEFLLRKLLTSDGSSVFVEKEKGIIAQFQLKLDFCGASICKSLPVI